MASEENTAHPPSQRAMLILRHVHNHCRTHSYPPSIREIAQAVGLASPSTVKHHLDVLEREGFLQRVQGVSRALEVSESGRLLLGEDPAPVHAATASFVDVTVPVSYVDEDATGVPLVGRIAAGAPITAEQNVEEVFHLPTRLTGHGNLFMLEIHGDSMVEAGILDGDYVVVRAQASAHDGEIVAAMVDEEATVKVLSHADGHVWLLPRNPYYEPILGDSATILGRVVTVMRAL